MLHRWFCCIFLLLAFLNQGFCEEQTCCYYEECPCVSYSTIQPVLEFKAGYFFFADAKMRKIYDHGGLDLQLSGSFPIWCWLEIYASVEYLHRSGRSLGGHQKTTIWELPVSVGLKPVIEICPWLQYYIAAGPQYFYLHQHNHSSFVNRNISHNGVGGFVNTGFNFLWCHLLVDIFGEYSYRHMHFHSHKTHVYGRGIQVGGFTFGGGLGYSF